MASEKQLNIRLQCKIDTYENWKSSDLILLAGEIGIATSENGSSILVFGNGKNTFIELENNNDYFINNKNIISIIQVELDNLATDTFAPINNPVFTGNPQSPTPTNNDNSKNIANTEFVNIAITNGTAAKAKAIDTQSQITSNTPIKDIITFLTNITGASNEPVK